MGISATSPPPLPSSPSHSNIQKSTDNNILSLAQPTLWPLSSLFIIKHNFSPPSPDVHLLQFNPLGFVPILVHYVQDYEDWDEDVVCNESDFVEGI